MTEQPTMSRRPDRLGLYTWREAHQHAKERAMRMVQMEWLQAVQRQAPPEEIERLARLFVQAKRECQ